ncbi:Hypothetical protein NGAL_HAMBI2427_54480 [Neorhizobium galegae bv. orientalis]|nr:Hypothetical protein NGAL_HAMBI2427_54480 [Neorhizobium galegae bv. orientalis]
MQLTSKWIHRIAEALEVHPGDVFQPPQAVPIIWLYGSIKRGNLANFEPTNPERYVVPLDDPEDTASVWLGVMDDSLAPFFHWGDALRFTSYYEDIHTIAEGRLVFITTDDGREILGTLEKVHAEFVFDIRTMTGVVHKGVKSKLFRLFTAAQVRALDDETVELIEKYSRNGLLPD